MTETTTTPAPAVLPAATPDPRGLCDVCRHPAANHDAIASRFCDATLLGALSRGCICRV